MRVFVNDFAECKTPLATGGKAAVFQWAGLAQMVEQWFCKPKVAGSSPASGTNDLIADGRG